MMVGWRTSPILFRYRSLPEIFHFYAEVSNRGLDLGVTE
jgi:hypothetical protein